MATPALQRTSKTFLRYKNGLFWPSWFIWVLFLFNVLFALFHQQYKKLSGACAIWLSALGHRPFLFFIVASVFTWLLYVPMAYHVGAGTWTESGPFDFQLSRILLYFGYFSAGILIGSTEFNHGLFSTASSVVKKWWLWGLLSLVVYAVLTLIPEPLIKMVQEGSLKEFNGWMIYYTVYVISCTTSCIAFMAIFRKWMNTGRDWLNSLAENAYLIYLVHFPFIVWIQFLLLNNDLPALVKFLITFAATMLLSWLASALLRNIKVIRTYL